MFSIFCCWNIHDYCGNIMAHFDSFMSSLYCIAYTQHAAHSLTIFLHSYSMNRFLFFYVLEFQELNFFFSSSFPFFIFYGFSFLSFFSFQFSSSFDFEFTGAFFCVSRKWGGIFTLRWNTNIKVVTLCRKKMIINGFVCLIAKIKCK